MTSAHTEVPHQYVYKVFVSIKTVEECMHGEGVTNYSKKYLHYHP